MSASLGEEPEVFEAIVATAYRAFVEAQSQRSARDMRTCLDTIELAVLRLELLLGTDDARTLAGRSRAGACVVELARLIGSHDGLETGLVTLNEISLTARDVLGAAHPTTVAAELNAAVAEAQLASAHGSVATMERAVGRLDRATTGLKVRLGPEHPRTSAALAGLAAAQTDLDRLRVAPPALAPVTTAVNLPVILERARAGDFVAFEIAVNHYAELVFGYAAYWVQSLEFAEMITSETFLRAVLTAPVDSALPDADAWLLSIARTVVAEHYGLGRTMVATPGPEAEQSPLLVALRSLPPEQQESLLLRFEQGLSTASTAQVMGTNEDTVTALQYAAVRSLHEVLSDALRSTQGRAEPVHSLFTAPFAVGVRARIPRQRARRFAELLDEAATGRRKHRRESVDAELAPLTQLVTSLGDVPLGTPDEEFRAGLRAMLLAKAEREGIGTTATPPSAARPSVVLGPPVAQRTGGRVRATILAGVTAGALVVSGISFASDDALPGDPLYSVKRSTEQAQLKLAGSDANRGRLHLEFARGRWVEAGRVPADGVVPILRDMDAESIAGAKMLFTYALDKNDPASIEAVTAFVATQRTAVRGVTFGSAAAEEARRDSLSLLDEIEARARTVATALSTGCTTATIDRLGPIPNC